ncbi:hypothetical protein ACFXKD_00250 [Nocardiopsis aegyptia]|uniref:hypothetical protein n=1 Tax=Nocardiopsis aegyptia TaxID=220378 RepID=UPI00366AB785
MTSTALEPDSFLYRHRWLAIPAWAIGVVVAGWGGFLLLLGAYMGTANGAHPMDGPLLSSALYLLCAALPVSLVHLVLVLVGHRVRRASRIAGTLLLILVVAAFGAMFISLDLQPV